MASRTQLKLRVEGMTCDGCARHVTEALKAVKGVEQALVPSWRTGQATVTFSGRASEDELVKAVQRAGYRAIVQERAPPVEQQPVSTKKDAVYDLIVVGGGSAGFAAAIKGAELGFKVAIVEKGTIGGTCVNIGCVPSKTLIRAAEICYNSAYPNFEGLTSCPPPSDWQRVVKQKDELIAALRQGKYVDVMKVYPNITLIQGEARLVGGPSVTVDGRSYTPKKVILATGSSPWAPPIPGLVEAEYIDSTDALSLKKLPESLIVIGGGAIGLELAQLFARFAVKVTVLEALPHIVPAEEPEIAEALTGYLREEGLEVHANGAIKKVYRENGEYKVHGEFNGRGRTFEAKRLLVATGRRPNTSGFITEKAGIQLGRKGEVIVNEHLQTTNRDVYAAGDVIGDPMFVYVAAYAGGLAAENSLTGVGRIFDLYALPRVTFTDPQIASVGLTEAQAKQRGLNIQSTILPLKEVPRALASRDTRGLIKLVMEKDTECLVGAHVLASECAGDVIQEATLAIRFKLCLKDILETFHPYLTMVEGMKLAALSFRKEVSQLSCCAT